MRLYHHPESDVIFWDFQSDDPFCNDVTDDAKFVAAAEARGITPPEDYAVRYKREVAATGGMAGAITKSYKTWERKPSDFYPTPFEGTESLIPVIKTLLPDGGRIWEPCCGDLDMTRVLEWHGYEVTSSDLRHTGQGIGGFDFLNHDPTLEWGWDISAGDQIDMICMNPPFSLAADFIEKALSYTPNVACLMKIDYWNAISRLPLWKSRQPAFFFPLTWRLAFLKAERGNSPLMNCAWAVWLDDEHRDLGKDICVMEPMPKMLYPGYNKNGVRTSFAKYGQAVDDLTKAMGNGR